MWTKICPECYVVFNTEFRMREFCSDECKKRTTVKCLNCNNLFSKNRYGKAQNYCSPRCRNIGKGKSILINCNYCEVEFYRSRVFFERYKKHYCSEKCQHNALRNTITKTCENCEKEFECIPSRYDEKRYCTKSCRRGHIDYEDLVEYYLVQGLSAESTGNMLGVSETLVFRHLKQYQIPTRHAGNSDWLKCDDGDYVRSSYEKIFDDILYKNNIEHEYDSRLPFSKRYMSDFKIEDVYVEIWGIVGSAKYDERRLLKQKLYKENNCKLVNVYPEDFKNINSKINELKRLIS